MDLDQGQQQSENVQGNQSLNKLQTLKTIITEILFSNTAYDCMPVNSSIQSIDKSVNFYDAVNMFLQQQVEQLLVWDQNESKWIWMLTIVDINRLIFHGLYCVQNQQPLNYSNLDLSKSSSFQGIDQEKLKLLITLLRKKTLGEIINELNQQSSKTKNYIRLKSVVKQSKLSYIVLTMISQKIHRIIIEDVDSRMMISIITFKDILLYLLRIANQTQTQIYSNVCIKSLIEGDYFTQKVVYRHEKLTVAFKKMTDIYRSKWINVVDNNNVFCGMIFRQDIRSVYRKWNLQQLFMTVGEYLDLKINNDHSKIPEFRYFDEQDTTKQIIWKIVMSRRNTIINIDKNNGSIKATIGLLQLFNLYVQGT